MNDLACIPEETKIADDTVGKSVRSALANLMNKVESDHKKKIEEEKRKERLCDFDNRIHAKIIDKLKEKFMSIQTQEIVPEIIELIIRVSKRGHNKITYPALIMMPLDFGLFGKIPDHRVLEYFVKEFSKYGITRRMDFTFDCSSYNQPHLTDELKVYRYTVTVEWK